jgi:acyl-CoA synthetase (AMP-forming)/AMP-acid ligase II
MLLDKKRSAPSNVQSPDEAALERGQLLRKTRRCGSADAAGARLAAYKTPDEILFVDPLPKNPTSKIHHRALREKLAPAEASQGWQSEFERLALGARIHCEQGVRRG